MHILAPAKVNLYLNITGVRRDGYHAIETIFQTVDLADRLDVTLGEGPFLGEPPRIDLSVRAQGKDRAHCPAGPGNIVWRAAAQFLEGFRIRRDCRIRLEKDLPIQAGLGGGSSDAGAVLRALWKQAFRSDKIRGPGAPRLRSIARSLGADVPFFLEGGCAFAGGIGEKLTPLRPGPRFWAVVVKPRIGLSTKEVYGWYDAARARSRLTSPPRIHKIISSIRRGAPLLEWSARLYNCFEQVVFPKVPELGEIKGALIQSGAAQALLSGSGSALFGLAPSRAEAAGIFRRMKTRFKGLELWVVRSL